MVRHYLEYSYLKTRDLEKAINVNANDFWIILEPKSFIPVKLQTGKNQSEAKILTKEGQAPHFTDLSATIASLTDSWEQEG